MTLSGWRKGEAMSDLIDRKALIAEYDRVHVGPPGGARKLMEEAPAVDAVEVVRCGKCEELHHEWYCCLSGMPVDEDDFCSFGKEKR